jgi:secretion/DNA translocation related TadE-like protein
MSVRCRDARGNVSIFVAAFIVVAMLLCTAVARLGSAAAEKARANNAADASALAAADGLALGRPPSEACAAARSTASDNKARVLTCRCESFATGMLAAEVTLEIDTAKARARAEVDAGGSRELRAALVQSAGGR